MRAWQVAGSEFIEADGNGLAEIHGGLTGVRRNFHEEMAVGKIFAREAVFFRSEDEGDSTAASQFAVHTWSQIGQRDERLLGFAAAGGSGTHDESCF